MNPILNLAGGALEAALARLVALDPATAERLRALDGRSVELHWTDTGLAARIAVDGDRLRVGPARDEKPDLGIKGSLAGFVHMAMRERGGAGLPGGASTRIEMNGDATLARELAKIAERYAPDLERNLSDTLGPVLGPQLARALASALDWAKASTSTLADDAGTFLRDESRDGVAKDELDAFADDVDRLRDDVDRLAARLAKLERSRAG